MLLISTYFCFKHPYICYVFCMFSTSFITSLFMLKCLYVCENLYLLCYFCTCFSPFSTYIPTWMMNFLLLHLYINIQHKKKLAHTKNFTHECFHIVHIDDMCRHALHALFMLKTCDMHQT